MATELNPGGAATVNEAIALRYEANSNTNKFTDAEKTKLAGVAPGANNYVAPNHTGDITSTGDGVTVLTDKAVTLAKMNDLAAQTVIGRGSGTGVPQAIVAGTDGVLRRSGAGNLSFGTIDTSNITDAAVTSAKLANVPTATVKGRVAAGTGVSTDLTQAQLTTLINTFTTSLSGAVPAASGGSTTTQFLRKDGTWAVPSGASFAAIAEDILPDTNNTRDLGSDTLRWAEGHFATTLKLGGYSVVTENTTALTEKTTLVDADKIPIFDSEATDATKYATRATIRTGLALSSRTLTAGTGLTGGGDLSANRTFALSSGSIASLALADTSVQPARSVSAGTGLTGGGSLAADRTISLSSGSIASLALADTSVQPARSISAGTGLTGGGSLAADRTISLSAGSIASLALADAAAPKLVTINAKTAAYTWVLGDAGSLITANVASANQQTIPANSSVAFAVGTVIVIQNIGAGVCTVKGATGVTLNGVSAGGGTLAQWAAASFIKTATDTWLAMGGIGTVA